MVETVRNTDSGYDSVYICILSKKLCMYKPFNIHWNKCSFKLVLHIHELFKICLSHEIMSQKQASQTISKSWRKRKDVIYSIFCMPYGRGGTWNCDSQFCIIYHLLQDWRTYQSKILDFVLSTWALDETFLVLWNKTFAISVENVKTRILKKGVVM